MQNKKKLIIAGGIAAAIILASTIGFVVIKGNRKTDTVSVPKVSTAETTKETKPIIKLKSDNVRIIEGVATKLTDIVNKIIGTDIKAVTIHMDKTYGTYLGVDSLNKDNVPGFSLTFTKLGETTVTVNVKTKAGIIVTKDFKVTVIDAIAKAVPEITKDVNVVVNTNKPDLTAHLDTDKAKIKEVKVDDTKVDYKKTGSYDIVYEVTPAVEASANTNTKVANVPEVIEIPSVVNIVTKSEAEVIAKEADAVVVGLPKNETAKADEVKSTSTAKADEKKSEAPKTTEAPKREEPKTTETPKTDASKTDTQAEALAVGNTASGNSGSSNTSTPSQPSTPAPVKPQPTAAPVAPSTPAPTAPPATPAPTKAPVWVPEVLETRWVETKAAWTESVPVYGSRDYWRTSDGKIFYNLDEKSDYVEKNAMEGIGISSTIKTEEYLIRTDIINHPAEGHNETYVVAPGYWK